MNRLMCHLPRNTLAGVVFVQRRTQLLAPRAHARCHPLRLRLTFRGLRCLPIDLDLECLSPIRVMVSVTGRLCLAPSIQCGKIHMYMYVSTRRHARGYVHCAMLNCCSLTPQQRWCPTQCLGTHWIRSPVSHKWSCPLRHEFRHSRLRSNDRTRILRAVHEVVV